MSTSLRSTLCGLLLVFGVVCAIYAQDSKSKSLLNLDFSNDPCGNPLIENQLWRTMDGEVSRVFDGRAFLVVLPHSHSPLRVRLAGVFLEAGDPMHKKTTEVLSQLLRGKPVQILVNPDWDFEKKKPAEIAAVVHLRQTTSEVDDVGLSEPYVLRIRSGKCVPHPRHWTTLARLGGFLGEGSDASK
jgi:hypothetical protein